MATYHYCATDHKGGVVDGIDANVTEIKTFDDYSKLKEDIANDVFKSIRPKFITITSLTLLSK